MRAFGRPEQCRKRIGGDLKLGDAACDHEQRDKHEPVSVEMGRHRHEEAAGKHRGEREQNRPRISHLLQHEGGRERDHAIGQEERELRQHRFRVSETEHGFDAGHQRIDGRGDEAPHEEKRGDGGEGRIEAAFI